ncbi:MAG: protein kinase [Proteobacteria bacterium]|nr:protein kinase [Pseudomonadota bacterium]
MNPTLLLGEAELDPLASVRASTAAIADLAFGSLTADASVMGEGHLAFLPMDALELDLSDPAQCQFGDYALRELIGRGGMGMVYRAYQRSLDREVAIKLLAAGPWASRDFIERFQREAQNAARMQHPNIVAIYEVGSAEQLHFFSMRLIRGESLAAVIKREGKLAPQRAAALLRTIAEAVDYAHRLGVLHLDLKPANVLIDENGAPHVADFGLARRIEPGLAADNHEVSGTPSYMAPEQATAGAQRITPATDIWGLGAIGYELVTGQPPYLGESPQATLKLVVDEAPRDPRELVPGLSRDLAAILGKCMARDANARYASARDLAEDLTRFANGYMVKARPLNTLQRSARWARREPKIVGTALVALLALLIGLATTTTQWRRANANAKHAAHETLLAEEDAAVSNQRLWQGRHDIALRRMRDGQGFAALAPLLDNIQEKQAAGQGADTWIERREIGMIEHRGVALIDRFIIADANPMATALSPDGKLLAVTLNDASVRWYDTATLTERGRVDLLDYLGAGRVPILPRFIDDHRLLVFGEWFDFLPNPGTSGVLIDLDQDQVAPMPKNFADLADVTWAADGQHALLHDTHGRVQLWQVAPWRALSALTPEHESNGVHQWLLDPQLRFAVQFGRNMRALSLFDPHHLDASRPVALPPHESFSAWAASADGAWLALGTHTGQILVLDLKTLHARQLPGTIGSRVTWLSFSADSAWLAAARSDGAVAAYDVASGEPLYAGQVQANFDATRVDIDRRSRLLVVSGLIAGGAGAAQIWHLPEPNTMPGPATPLIASPTPQTHAAPYWLSSAPRAGLLASAGMGGEIRLWRLPLPAALDAHQPVLNSDNLHSDGDHVVDVRYDRLRVLSTAHGKATAWLPLPPPIAFAQLDADAKTLVTVARTGLHVLDATTLQPRIPTIALAQTPEYMTISADGRLAALGLSFSARDGMREHIAVYDLANGQRLDHGDLVARGPLRQFVLAPDDSRLLATGPADGATEVFDMRALKAVGVYPHDPEQPVIWGAFTAHAHRVWLVTRNSDDTLAGNADLLLWDLATGKIIERRHVPGVYPVGIAVVGDKPLLAGRDRLVLDPDAPDEHSITGLRDGEATTTFAVSHDGRLVAHAFGRQVQLYDASDLTPVGAPLWTQSGQMNAVIALAFSADDRHLLANLDNAIVSTWRLWPLAGSTRSVDALRADAALLAPPDAGSRVLRIADSSERARLRARDPGPPPNPEPERVVAERWIGPDPMPPRDPAATALQIDMGAVYNRAPTSEMNVMDSIMAALSDLPFGLPRIDGIDYDLRGGLEMRSQGSDARSAARQEFAAPAIVRGLRAPPQPIAALHVLLYAPESVGEPRERVYATVRLHYRDGTQAVLPIRTQLDVPGWTDHDLPTPVGWVIGDMARIIGVLREELISDPRLPNPHPEKIIQSIDLETADQGWSTPVFLAITAEPVDKAVGKPVIAGVKSLSTHRNPEREKELPATDGKTHSPTNGDQP